MQTSYGTGSGVVAQKQVELNGTLPVIDEAGNDDGGLGVDRVESLKPARPQR